MHLKIIFISSLSLIRIPLAFLFFYFLYYQNLDVAFIVLLISALSDKLDGTLARRFGLGAMLWGKIFDPLGDRIFMVISFTALAIVDLSIKPGSVAIYLTIGQDLVLTPFGAFMFLKKRMAVVSPIGKMTTFYQFIFLIMILGLNLYHFLSISIFYFEIALVILNLASAAHHIYVWLQGKKT